MFRLMQWIAGSALRIAGAVVCAALVFGGGTIAVVKGVEAPKTPAVSEQAGAGASASNGAASANGSANAGNGSAGASGSASASAPGASVSSSPSASGTLPTVGSLPSVNVPSPNPVLPTKLPNVVPSLPTVPTPSVPALPTPSLPSVAIPGPSPLPLPTPSQIPNLGVPVAVSAGTNPLALYTSGSYSVTVPSVPGHSATYCLGYDSNTPTCKTVATPTSSSMTLTLSFTGNASLLPPTFTPLPCGSGVGYAIQLDGATPGTAVTVSVRPIGGIESVKQATNKSVYTSLCLS